MDTEQIQSYDMSIHSSGDAREWARFFCKTLLKNKDIVIDEEFMTGWFANAMMAMYDSLKKDIAPKYY